MTDKKIFLEILNKKLKLNWFLKIPGLDIIKRLRVILIVGQHQYLQYLNTDFNHKC